MFKNESSELLLARIDALSRFVRQRKRLTREQQRLDGIVDTLAGATLVVDREDTISYASRQAVSLLGFESTATLLGQHAGQVIDLRRLRESTDGKFRAEWRDASERLVGVVYRQIRLDETGDLVLNFKLLPGNDAEPVQQTDQQASELVVERLQLPADSMPFVSELKGYASSASTAQEYVSLLMLDTFFTAGDGRTQSTHHRADLAALITRELHNVYKRQHHVARLGANRYGFLLRHTTEPQAYLLTRKIMQLCNATDTGNDPISISCSGCLFSVTNNRDKSAAQILQLTIQGMNVVNERGHNQALLLDLRRMLPVYVADE